ncbi:hypothetical protein GZH52_08745 [Crenobacter sp. HX-7-9]|uniref:Uncharacterized protein n=2 Tax=Crenobacter caeni TaxID=2705474 RepID=A0A6B2KRU8_9NEIS|nr:hypothetical protein [Crenobacter caeni]
MLIAFSLTGCAQLGLKPVTPAPVVPAKPAQVAPAPADLSERLLFEANRLAEEVKAGRLTRTQAADQLGRARIAWVGRNPVDDETFRLYRQISVERDTGQISQAESQRKMDDALKRWQRRWVQLPLSARPANPAFTNFLMKVYGLPPLQ